MKPSEFSARGRNRRLSVGDEVATSTRETHLAAAEHKMATGVAAKKALIAIGLVMLIVGLLLVGLWWTYMPDIPAYRYTAGCDRGNPWCGQ